AAIADDIAYDAHDIDDGLRAAMFPLDALRSLPLVGGFLDAMDRSHPGLEAHRLINEITRRLITAMVEDVIRTATAKIAETQVSSVDDVRAAGRPLVCFSPEMAAVDRAVKAFLFPNLYRNPDVVRVRRGADRIVRD